MQRSTNVKINSNQVYPSFSECQFESKEEQDLVLDLDQLANKVQLHYSNGNFYMGIDEVMRVLRNANLFFHNQKPWELVKQSSNQSSSTKLVNLLALVYECCRISSILLWPITPRCSEIALQKLNCNLIEQLNWSKAKPGCASIDSKKLIINSENLIVYSKTK